MDPEKKEIPFGNPSFSGSVLVFGGVSNIFQLDGSTNQPIQLLRYTTPRYAGQLLLPFVQEFLKVVSEAGGKYFCGTTTWGKHDMPKAGGQMFSLRILN